MAPAAGPALPSDRAPMRVPVEVVPPQAASAAAVASAVGVTPPVAEMVARDSILAWYRGEFAAANAIVDALCNHLTQLNNIGAVGGSSSEYEAVFIAIHRRRLNWIPVLQMQKYFSIADVALELRKPNGFWGGFGSADAHFSRRSFSSRNPPSIPIEAEAWLMSCDC
ncbi:hypothetical protein Ancab_017648 [Ancistrocladus abbreviatus]